MSGVILQYNMAKNSNTVTVDLQQGDLTHDPAVNYLATTVCQLNGVSTTVQGV